MKQIDVPIRVIFNIFEFELHYGNNNSNNVTFNIQIGTDITLPFINNNNIIPNIISLYENFSFKSVPLSQLSTSFNSKRLDHLFKPIPNFPERQTVIIHECLQIFLSVAYCGYIINKFNKYINNKALCIVELGREHKSAYKSITQFILKNQHKKINFLYDAHNYHNIEMNYDEDKFHPYHPYNFKYMNLNQIKLFTNNYKSIFMNILKHTSKLQFLIL